MRGDCYPPSCLGIWSETVVAVRLKCEPTDDFKGPEELDLGALDQCDILVHQEMAKDLCEFKGKVRLQSVGRLFVAECLDKKQALNSQKVIGCFGEGGPHPNQGTLGNIALAP